MHEVEDGTISIYNVHILIFSDNCLSVYICLAGCISICSRACVYRCVVMCVFDSSCAHIISTWVRIAVRVSMYRFYQIPACLL